MPKGEVCECGASDWEKDGDIMDVWFDSGSTWSAVCRERPELTWPVDLYMEGADQFRGWFQSSLLTCVATEGIAPYRGVLCHGWVVDAQGKQMHKSAGNGMEPAEIIRDYGADIIRLWVASSDYTVDVRAGKEIFRQLSEAYRKCATPRASCSATSAALTPRRIWCRTISSMRSTAGRSTPARADPHDARGV